MEIINVEIFHRDKEYAYALARILSENARGYSTAVIEDDRVHKDEKKDTDFDAVSDGKVIVYSSTQKKRKVISVYGYMKPLQLAIRVNEEMALSEFEEKHRITRLLDSESVKSKLILAAGLEGGAGATSIAEGLAQEFTLYYGKKVCRISFDAFSGGNNLKKLLYYWKKGCDLQKIASYYFIPDENNVFGILPEQSGQIINPMLLMDASDVVRFTEDVKTKLDFDYIIVDMSVLIYRIYAEMSKIAEKTVLVSKENKEKITKFAEQSETKSTIGVLNFADRYKECVKDESDETVRKVEQLLKKIEIATIEVDKEIVKSTRINVDGIFGIGIKMLAEKIEF